MQGEEMGARLHGESSRTSGVSISSPVKKTKPNWSPFSEFKNRLPQAQLFHNSVRI